MIWDEMSKVERLDYLSRKFGIGFEAIDSNTCHRCELRLTPEQQKQYTDYVSSEVSAITYEGMTPAEISSPSVADKYYWNMLSLSPDIRAKFLWHTVEGYAP
jgi:hypothetical protein